MLHLQLATLLYDFRNDHSSGPATVPGRFIDDPLCSGKQQFLVGGLIALNDIKHIRRLFIHLGLFYLADLQPAKNLVCIITVTVFMRIVGDWFTLSDRQETLGSIRKAKRHVAFRAIDVMCAESQFAFHGDDVVNVHCLVDKEHIAMLFQKSNQVFTGRDVFPALHPGVVV